MKATGWGDPQKRMSLSQLPRLESFLKNRFAITPWPKPSRVSEEEIACPNPHPMPSEALTALTSLLTSHRVQQTRSERLTHGYGKSYLDLLRLRSGKIAHLPDAVIYPTTIEEIQKALTICDQLHISCIPFGGGTSVVGGIKTLRHPTVVMDLKNLNRVLALDPDSHLVHVQAGLFGPALEQHLNPQGFTLGHFPQSFEYSTVGGWIATRSAGQFSSKYGKIEHRVVALTVVTPHAIFQTTLTPAAATGPRLADIFVGSEGTLGIISDAWLRLDPLPQSSLIRGYMCHDFEAGLAICRQLAHLSIKPHLVRLSDGEETILSLLTSSTSTGLQQTLAKILDWRGYLPNHRCLLLLGFEGTSRDVRSGFDAAHSILKSGKCLSLGSRPGKQWMKTRFAHPYVRDALLDVSLMVDTFETASLWSTLPHLYEQVIKTLRAHLGSQALILGHLSHLYETGASLYFTVITPQDRKDPIAQWHAFKTKVSDCLLQHGGVISHHHGIGRDHLTHFQKQAGQPTLELLDAIKTQLDPHQILNPNKLIPIDSE